MNSIRQIIGISSVLVLTSTSYGQLRETEFYTIKQFAISHSQPVSFSIEYPKGWTKIENRLPDTGGLTMDDNYVCAFWSSSVATNWATIDVFRSVLETAGDAATNFVASVKQHSSTHNLRSLTPVKTSAGDAGFVAMCDANFERGKATTSDYFFHVGTKGAIHISVMTKAELPELHEHLQKLILQTLRF